MSQFPSIEEFDQGLSSISTATKESAPSADFMEREKQILADDAKQFENAEGTSSDNGLLNFDEPTALNGAEKDFESAFPPLQTIMQPSGTISAPAAPYMANADVHADDATAGNELSSSSAASADQAEEQQEEPETVRAWKEEYKKRIEDKQSAAARLREDNVSKAKASIDEFYENFNTKKEKLVAQVRAEQEEMLQKHSDDTSGSTAWQRIAKLVDLTDRSNVSGRDTSRFRKLLKSLADDEHAPGATVVA
ncbi:clathrin light chain [Schizosaccharomyces japonicus yFS275]|uniref:Clathrin light chain n=1 Tax=Schizosaccharomyces japonicus (strain yFS275 / FY16936) TaxID=402676 RepID=B6K714_SCHJY|nr:clathrin light chain [Schizosaccharomyces japonicus yFS275]EEB09318.2 clathrin light chain [Schizosaccharomyces japonicus yFS275]